MRKPLTDKQREVYDYIRSKRSEGSYPTYANISKHLGNSSANSANDYVKQLIKKGWLDRVEGTRPAYKLNSVRFIIVDDMEALTLEEQEQNQRTIGEIGNYYGKLNTKKENGCFYWSIENYSGHYWEEIPESLYKELLTFEKEREK